MYAKRTWNSIDTSTLPKRASARNLEQLRAMERSQDSWQYRNRQHIRQGNATLARGIVDQMIRRG